MAREQSLLRAFIEFADTIVDDYDVVEFLHRLAGRCVELVDASEAGIMLADEDGTLRYIASSSERMRLIELFELQHDEGPCLDAYRAGVAVHSVLDEDAVARWARFAPHARDVGFESVSALPMRLRSESIGALNLFSSTVGPLSADDQEVAQALADIATIGILQERAVKDARLVAIQLEAALESRVAIEQAKGIVAERVGVTIDDAFDLLRAYARRYNHLLRQTAEQIIDGTLSSDALIDPTPTARP
jgi:GAF domain-containing protein